MPFGAGRGASTGLYMMAMDGQLTHDDVEASQVVAWIDYSHIGNDVAIEPLLTMTGLT